MSYIAAALKVAQYLGGIGTAVALGEAVGKRVGVLQKDTSILVEAANIGLDVLGAPKNSAIRPGLPAAPAAQNGQPIGDAEQPNEESEPRIICVDCQVSSDMPLISGATGEEIVLGQCQKHYEQTNSVYDNVGALYSGWAKSYGIGDVASCGPKPEKGDPKYTRQKVRKIGKKHVKVVGYQDKIAYLKDLVEWQACAATEKDKSSSAASARQRRSAFALRAQQARYEKEIQALKDQMATEKDAQKAAEMQAKIDEATAAKATAEKLVEEMRQASKDTEMQAKLDALQATIAAQANKPGGMDELLKQILLQQLTQQQVQQQPVVDPYAAAIAQQQMMAATMDPLAMVAPAMPVPMVSPGTMQYDDPFAMYGTDDESAPLEPEAADLLGLSGARTLGEARAMFDLRQGGYTDDELAAALAGNDEPATSSCVTGSCGLLSG